MNQQREAALALFGQFGEKSQVAVLRLRDGTPLAFLTECYIRTAVE